MLLAYWHYSLKVKTADLGCVELFATTNCQVNCDASQVRVKSIDCKQSSVQIAISLGHIILEVPWFLQCRQIQSTVSRVLHVTIVPRIVARKGVSELEDEIGWQRVRRSNERQFAVESQLQRSVRASWSNFFKHWRAWLHLWLSLRSMVRYCLI